MFFADVARRQRGIGVCHTLIRLNTILINNNNNWLEIQNVLILVKIFLSSQQLLLVLSNFNSLST